MDTSCWKGVVNLPSSIVVNFDNHTRPFKWYSSLSNCSYAISNALYCFILVSFSFSVIVGIFSAVMYSNIESWCKKTPHLQSCHYHMCSNTNSFAMKQEPEFRKMSVQIAFRPSPPSTKPIND